MDVFFVIVKISKTGDDLYLSASKTALANSKRIKSMACCSASADVSDTVIIIGGG